MNKRLWTILALLGVFSVSATESYVLGTGEALTDGVQKQSGVCGL